MDTDWVGLILVLFYLAIVYIGSQQTYRAFKSRNRFLSIRNSIVLLLTASAFLRLILWVKVCVPGDLDDTFMLLMFFLPMWFNFAALSLLAVFYTEAVYGGKTLWPMRIYLVVNLALLTMNVYVATGTASRLDNTDDETPVFTAFSIVYNSFVDFLLAILLCYYGYQFQKICNENGNALTTWTASSVTIFESINWMLIVIYVFRGIAAAVISQHPDVMGQVEYDGNHPPTRASVLMFFFVTEILPSLCVMLMLWRIGGSSVARIKIESMAGGDGGDGGDDAYNHLNTRLLSIEDSKVRILMGKDSMRNENDNVLFEGENTTEYLLFSNVSSPRKQGSVGFEKNNDDDTQLLLQNNSNPSKGDVEQGVPSAVCFAAANPDAAIQDSVPDYSKYSISAESSFLDENVKSIFVGNDELQSQTQEELHRKTSPLVIAGDNGVEGGMSGSGVAGSLTDWSPRIGFGARRGSWNNNCRGQNQYISKRTPSPMLPDGQRNSDGDDSISESPMMLGSFPLNATGLYLVHGGGGSQNSLVGMGRGTSSNNLAAMTAVSEDVKEEDAANSANKARSQKEKYADTLSPMDILRKSQQHNAQKKGKKGKK